MSKDFRSFDDVPQDVRNNILGVIAANHIDFDPTKITGGVKGTLNFTETKNTNGRLGYNGDITTLLIESLIITVFVYM